MVLESALDSKEIQPVLTKGSQSCNPLQYSCLENPHKQRSLAGYSPWDGKSQTQRNN